jgi:hypothetical protein
LSLLSSRNIIRLLKPRIITGLDIWLVLGRTVMCTEFSVGKPEEKFPFGGLNFREMVMLNALVM